MKSLLLFSLTFIFSLFSFSQINEITEGYFEYKNEDWVRCDIKEIMFYQPYYMSFLDPSTTYGVFLSHLDISLIKIKYSQNKISTVRWGTDILFSFEYNTDELLEKITSYNNERIELIYSRSDDLTVLEAKFIDNTKIEGIEYFYFQKGRYIPLNIAYSKPLFSSGDKNGTFQYIHCKEKNIIKEIEDGSCNTYSIYQYNENDDIISISRYKNEILVDSTYLEYKYDNNQNWTEKTIIESDNKYLIKREITYSK